jgi:hypothetical protein
MGKAGPYWSSDEPGSRHVRRRAGGLLAQGLYQGRQGTLMSLDPTGDSRRRWTMRWKAPLNAFQIAFEGRLTPAND